MRGSRALALVLAIVGNSGAAQAANQADVCIGRPADAKAPLLVISGPIENSSAQTEGLRKSLAARHGRAMRAELMTIEERDPAGIPRQLDRARLSGRVAILTSSAYIATAVMAMDIAPPVLFATFVDPKEWGLVDELGRRKVNATGISYSVDLDWKFVEMLRLAAPKARRFGFLGDAYVLGRPIVRDMVEHGFERMGVQIVPFEAVDRAELERVFASPAARSVDGWIVPESPVVFRHEDRLVELVRATRKPHIFGYRRILEKGAAMTFGADFTSLWDEMADMVDRVCKGVDVRDIPVLRPHHVFFGVSPANARAIGWTLDPRVYPLATFWR
jgi:ABC-type uncharacterized transport system substrate-binding protein